MAYVSEGRDDSEGGSSGCIARKDLLCSAISEMNSVWEDSVCAWTCAIWTTLQTEPNNTALQEVVVIMAATRCTTRVTK